MDETGSMDEVRWCTVDGDNASSRIGVPTRCPHIAFERTSEETPRQRRPRDNTNSKVLESGEHLALFLSVHKRMMVLH